MSRLVAAGEISDESGMASTVLAREVGYPGTSIAFAQLLSGMERSGLIQREVRGKRTYRITAAPGSGTRLVPTGEHRHLSRPGTAAGLDYDELARRLLVQVVRELAVARRELARLTESAQGGPGAGEQGQQAGRPAGPSPHRARTPDGAQPAQAPAATDGALPAEPGGFLSGTWPGRVGSAPAQPGDSAAGAWPDSQDGPSLDGTVADLKRELASALALHSRVSAENARLREQLRAARKNLARLRGLATRRPVTEELDADETGLLDHLLAPGGKADDSDDPAPVARQPGQHG